ncbi:MAG: hypothetical protein KC493_01600 [Bacteriovoracaceae bacterium]|nr:hypothetical protein [Bacteriovoracaceae bacterium]
MKRCFAIFIVFNLTYFGGALASNLDNFKKDWSLLKKHTKFGKMSFGKKTLPIAVQQFGNKDLSTIVSEIENDGAKFMGVYPNQSGWMGLFKKNKNIYIFNFLKLPNNGSLAFSSDAKDMQKVLDNNVNINDVVIEFNGFKVEMFSHVSNLSMSPTIKHYSKKLKGAGFKKVINKAAIKEFSNEENETWFSSKSSIQQNYKKLKDGKTSVSIIKTSSP